MVLTSPSRSNLVPYVAVIGPGAQATEEECETAREAGRLLADRNAIVVCGGLGGVMAAACQGAFERGGTTVGLLPGRDRSAGNPYLTVAVPTGLGELRNGLVVRTSDAIIAVGGSWGTLSEVALAVRTGKPVVVIGGWRVEDPAHGLPEDRPVSAVSARDAVDRALRLAGSRLTDCP
jgi:uncharacterized protein (TIGR00725 family)